MLSGENELTQGEAHKLEYVGSEDSVLVWTQSQPMRELQSDEHGACMCWYKGQSITL